MTVRSLLLPAALVLGLSACSSSRSSYPNGRTIPTPDGNVIVMDDGRVYRDRDRDGRPDVLESERRDGRTNVCHRGRTITVSGSAVDAHVRHGDYVGRCGSGGAVDRNGNGRIDRDERVDRNGDGRIDARDQRRDERVDRDDDHDDDRRERGRENRGRGNGRGNGRDKKGHD